NNTLWRPDSCQECQCFSDITICQPAACLNPHCDYQRGERLRIPPNQCCPECLPSSQGSCQHEEAVYGCILWSETLPSSQLPPRPYRLHPHRRLLPQGQTKVKRAGQCCDECVAAKGSCLYELTVRYHGCDEHCEGCQGPANSQAPTLRITGSLLVPIGGTKPLVSTLLIAQDQDSPPESLVFQLLQPPSTGCVVVLEGGREKEMARDDTFSWAQLQSGQVRFTHDKDKARSGQFSVRVADPQLFSQAETIQVHAVSMQ
ncbi:unnamed protein product, partial [Coregonus sp. 'balchen']